VVAAWRGMASPLTAGSMATGQDPLDSVSIEGAVAVAWRSASETRSTPGYPAGDEAISRGKEPK